MKSIHAKPELLKQVNLASIRKTIKTNCTATRSEIAAATKISLTTIRALLAEMLENGEIRSIGYDDSSGGRKAERYALNPDRYFGACLCVGNAAIDAMLVDVCGDIREKIRLDVGKQTIEQAAIRYLDVCAARAELRSIGIGVPGIAKDGSYRRLTPGTNRWENSDIGDALFSRYGVPVVLENNINAMVIGCKRRLETEAPNSYNSNMAFLHFEPNCIRAGFMAEGKIIRGTENFAGELGLLCPNGERSLDDLLSAAADDRTYASRVAEIVGWICVFLNPEFVALGGPAYRDRCTDEIRVRLDAVVPDRLRPALCAFPDPENDYHRGMARLTAEKMFDGVTVVKE